MKILGSKKGMRFGLATVLMAVGVLAVLSLGPIQPANAQVPVSATVGEWFVSPMPGSASIAAGGDHIIFTVTNMSTAGNPHEFLLIRLRHGQTEGNLPINTNPTSEFFGRVDEPSLGPQIITTIEAVPPEPAGTTCPDGLGLFPGVTCTMDVKGKLAAGDYALICNLPPGAYLNPGGTVQTLGHYLAGMHTGFTIVSH